MRCLLAVLVLVHSAAAEPRFTPSVRVSAAFGALEEYTWAYPEVDGVVTLGLGDRGYASALIGYTRLDNHTYLADGRSIRLALAGGVTVFERVRAGATFSLELVSFDPDPDTLRNHPDVDIFTARGGVLPMGGLELSRAVGATRIGLFTRIALEDLRLFDTPSGDRLDARLVLGGAYLELPL